MELKDIKELITSVIEEMIGISLPNENTRLIDAGVDSMKMIELVLELENRFDIEFEHEMLSYKTLRTVSSIAEYVYKRINEKTQ